MLTNEFRSGVGAHWTFLSDAGRVVQKDLDIAEYTDPAHNPMIPYTIVLEPGLVVFKIYNGYWFFGRPTNEELRQDLRAVLKKCRADWDISTPELKAAWQRGEKNRFLSLRQNLRPGFQRAGINSQLARSFESAQLLYLCAFEIGAECVGKLHLARAFAFGLEEARIADDDHGSLRA